MIEWVDLSRHLVIRDQLWVSTNVYIELLETVRLRFFVLDNAPEGRELPQEFLPLKTTQSHV